MTIVPPDGSRDRRIEDPTNLWIIHPASRLLLPVAINAGVSANVVSCIGLACGAGAAIAYANWNTPAAAVAGLLLSIAWLIADGLDGMVARATQTASAMGRVLDGIVDHGVFAMIYVVLAASIGTLEAWLLATAAGIAHAVQSSLFEGERARFHRRVKGDWGATPPARIGNPLEQLYDSVSRLIDRLSAPFDRALREARDPARLGADYGVLSTQAMRAMAFESANMRVIAIFGACLAGDPRLFWWFEIVPLSLLIIVTLIWHRRIETALLCPDNTTTVNT